MKPQIWFLISFIGLVAISSLLLTKGVTGEQTLDATLTSILTSTNPPLPDTPTAVPPYPSATPVDSAYAPAVFEQARPATATISPDATATIWLTATALPAPDTPTPRPSATPVDSAYAPVVFEQARTATATPTSTATISPDATPTIYITTTPIPP